MADPGTISDVAASSAAASSAAVPREEAEQRASGEASCSGRELLSATRPQVGCKPPLGRSVASAPSLAGAQWLDVRLRPEVSSSSGGSHGDPSSTAGGGGGSPTVPCTPNNSLQPPHAATSSHLPAASRPRAPPGILRSESHARGAADARSKLGVGLRKNVSFTVASGAPTLAAMRSCSDTGAAQAQAPRAASSAMHSALERNDSALVAVQLSHNAQMLDAVVVDVSTEGGDGKVGGQTGGGGGGTGEGPAATAGPGRSMRHTLSRSLSINPWRPLDPLVSSTDTWHRLPNVCKALLLLSVADSLLLIAFAIVLVANVSPDQDVHFPIGVCLLALFHLAFVGSAVFRENTILLILDALLVALICIGASIYTVFEVQHVEMGGRWPMLGLIIGFMAATIVVESLAWRKFGWRMYSRFAIDFRQSDAAQARRLWTSASCLSALLLYNIMAQVVMSAIAISVASCDCHELMPPAPMLAVNIAGLLTVLAVSPLVYYTVRERKRHRYIWCADVAMPIMLVTPLCNLVLVAATLGGEERDAQSTYEYAAVLVAAAQAVLGTLAAWVTMHCVVYFWGKLGRSRLLRMSSSALREALEGFPAELEPLLKGAWLGKPTRLNLKKKRFFQLSTNLMVLRWDWLRWVDLHYVDSVTLHEASMSMVIKLTAESDLLLRFPDETTYEQWKAGFRVLMELVLGGIDMTESGDGGGGNGNGSIITISRQRTSSDNEPRTLPYRGSRRRRAIDWLRGPQACLAASGAPFECIVELANGLRQSKEEEADAAHQAAASGELSGGAEGIDLDDEGDEAQRAKREELEQHLSHLNAQHRHHWRFFADLSRRASTSAQLDQALARDRPRLPAAGHQRPVPAAPLPAEAPAGAVNTADAPPADEEEGGAGGGPRQPLAYCNQVSLARERQLQQAYGSIWDQILSAETTAPDPNPDICLSGAPPAEPLPRADATGARQEGVSYMPTYDRRPSFNTPFAGPSDVLIFAPAVNGAHSGDEQLPDVQSGGALSQPLDGAMRPCGGGDSSGGGAGEAANCGAYCGGSAGLSGSRSLLQSDELGSGGEAGADGRLATGGGGGGPEDFNALELKGGSGELLRRLSEWSSNGCGTSLGTGTPLRITVEVVDPGELGPLEVHLGGGAQGDVWRTKLRGTDVAVKVFRDVLHNPGCALRMLHEVRLHLAIGRHDNVISVRGVSPAREAEIWLVMEYAPRGSLEELLQVMRYKKRHIEPRKLLDMVRSVARGLLHLHSKRILHRDLKPANIFVDMGQTLKLGDFGHACFVTDDGPDLPEPGPGVPEALQWGPATPAYAAPECWSQLGSGASHAGVDVLAADIWAFGLVLWQLLTMQALYYGIPSATITAWHLTGAYENLALPPVTPPRNCAADVAVMYDVLGALVQQCTAVQPSKRPHIRAVMANLKSIRLTPKPSTLLEGLL